MVFTALLSRVSLSVAWAAARDENTGRLRKCLQLGLDDESKGNLLHNAIFWKYIKSVEVLLEFPMPLDEVYDSKIPLEVALDRGVWEVVPMLINKGADVNKISHWKNPVLHSVVYRTDEATVRLAIEKGGDLNLKSPDGGIALHAAAKSGQHCRLLVELGSPVDPIDNAGLTPFIWAARWSSWSGSAENALRELAGVGANLQLRDNQGNTALHYAADSGSDKLIPVLVELGLDINATNDEGRTALHIAVDAKHADTVRELALLDADIEIRDNHGVTALQLATMSNEQNTVKLLKRLLETKIGATPSKSPHPSSQGLDKPINPRGRDFGRITTSSSRASSLDNGKEEPQCRESKIWLDRIQRSPVTAEQVSQFTKLDRIKIAVLDTGYDPDSDFFRDRARKRRIKKFEDWTDNGSTAPKDEDGHGTHVLSLVMKVAPAADLFVCRIARGQEAEDLHDASGYVAEAITRAAIDWEVDIISLSFGYPEEVLVKGVGLISNAISRALAQRNQRLLMFAAASNGGPSELEMFPANSPFVMSIRGSDAKGWLQTFNALPNPDGIKCFMTLGQSVPGAPLSRENGKGEVYQSGTSSATPIAAGIAAIVLGYARVHEEELKQRLGDDKHKLSKLWRISGMRAMFAAISSESFHRCLSLDPFKFTEESHQKRLHLITEAVWKAI